MTGVPIIGFPNYRVTQNGEIVTTNGIVLKQSLSNNGYLRVSLSNKKQSHRHFLVHRLVANAFIPNPYHLPQVHHKDEDRTNNSVDNLEWVTPLENLRHSSIIEKAAKAKQTTVLCEDLNMIFDSIEAAAETFGLHHANIVACCKGRRKKCGGMKWSYVTT